MITAVKRINGDIGIEEFNIKYNKILKRHSNLKFERRNQMLINTMVKMGAFK